MSNHAKQLSKLQDGLNALSFLIQESLEQDTSQDKAEITAFVSDTLRKYAAKLVKDSASQLSVDLTSLIETKITSISNDYTLLSDKINSFEKPTFYDREISGNKIHGGVITDFSSRGIRDNATKNILTISDSGIQVDVIDTSCINNNLKIEGNLETTGEIKAGKITVDEITADVRISRTSPLVFENTDTDSIANKGILWTGSGHTKQFVFLPGPDRIFSSESIDVNKGNEYKIGNQSVLAFDTLGPSVITSSLKKVGTLQNLKTNGSLNVNNYMFFDSDSNRLGLGTDTPNGDISILTMDHEFIISDDIANATWKVGTFTNASMDLITDGQTRLSISQSGKINVHSPANFANISVNGATNDDSVKLNVTGTIAQDGKKFEVGSTIPATGSYKQGDIVWNTNTQSKGYIGWVCIKSGTPGEWKTFGAIS